MLNGGLWHHGSHVTCQKKDSALGQLDSCISQSSVDLHINNLVSQDACLLGNNGLPDLPKQAIQSAGQLQFSLEINKLTSAR